MSTAGYLILDVYGECYAAALSDVAEITDPTAFHPLPKAPRYYRGLINCHGRPMPVIDLSLLFRGAPAAAGGKIVVLCGKSINLAMMVDNTLGIVKGDFPTEPATGTEPGVDRVVLAPGGTFKLIVPENLIAVLEEKING